VFLFPQETATVFFELTGDDFSLADESGSFHVISGDWTILVVALSDTAHIP
jgi:hypothetical protein